MHQLELLEPTGPVGEGGYGEKVSAWRVNLAGRKDTDERPPPEKR